ncbi:hypothetical protein FA13DRAFT_1736414 [Coprinellus micaceus]|uniref:Uncharacterized protein n=1 Tax=Coprinellus micaceus TaxID=71717 RepID=A0A4Y7T1Q1_COPMI|nr:hypothetical protein FA13DRAFT_1736414 [Coprinellus micaceus]
MPTSPAKATKLICTFLSAMNSNTVIELWHCLFHETLSDPSMRGVIIACHLLHAIVGA